MKKLYTLLTVVISAFVITTTSSAQSTSGKAQVGYVQYSAQIWEYDGLSLPYDATVGCAILLTKDILKHYVGGTITGMYVGWDTSTQSGTYNGFVRKDFNSENLSTGKATVRYNYSSSNPGWNTMTLTKYVIPQDIDQLVVGFTTNLKKDVCAIPKLYPYNQPNSCYLWIEGDNDENGQPIWRDSRNLGSLPIILIIQDSMGSFNYLPVITSMIDNGVVVTNEYSDCLVRVKNGGSMAIRNIEVTSRQGEQSASKTLVLSSSIEPGATSRSFLIPVCCFQTGDVEVSITKVNNKEVANPEVFKLNQIGVPAAVSEKYMRRPLVEYFESENNYRSPRYFDEYMQPAIGGKTEDITFVCQHLDDQFMTGDDDATALALRLCSNDSSAVSIPAMSIDRAMSTDNISYQQASSGNPTFDVLLPPYGGETILASIDHPTFVGVNVDGYWGEDGESIHVRVGGEVEPGVLPAGEKARVTVYVMERFVDSDSQLFWTEKEKEEQLGHYTHYNIVREILTAPEGDEIEGEGKFQTAYETVLDPSWKRDDLYLVAFVHRDGAKGGNFMHVFNSNEGSIDETDGIENVSVNANVNNANIYDLSGRRVNAISRKGVYVVGGKKYVR